MKGGRLRTTLLGVLLGSMLALSGAPAAQAASDNPASDDPAATFVDLLAERALGLLADPDLSEVERLNQFRELFRGGFAVQGIAKFSMGRYWRQADDAQREEYVALFEDVIIDSWSKRFTRFSGDSFDIREAWWVGGSSLGPSAFPSTPLSDAGDETVTIVSSLVWTSPESPIRVDWRVASNGVIFQITDVTVEGVSMANTQRDEYTALARRYGVNGLIDRLRLRTGEIERLAFAQSYDGAGLPASGTAPAHNDDPITGGRPILAVQVASLRSEARARKVWERVQQKFPELLADHAVQFEAVDLGERGTFTRVRVGAFDGFSAASALCSTLAEGGQDCLVVQR